MSNERFKFRVWSKKSNRYVNRYVIDDDGMAYKLHDAGEDSYDLIPDEEVIIERCIGLKDKNGKLIFKGDVLEKTRQESCYKTSGHEGFYLYKKRKKNGLIVEEKTDDRFNEIYYVFRTGETDVATMDRFPGYWLKNESFGWEGEELETPEDWVIIGNIHEMEKEK